MNKILIVDDESATRDFLARGLSANYQTLTASDGEEALKILSDNTDIDLILSDVRMPVMSGHDLVAAAKRLRPSTAVILLTAYGTVDEAVAAMKEGADDFITKPVDLDALEVRVAKTLAANDLKREVVQLRERLDEKYGMENIIGSSDAMKKVFRMIRQAAPTNATVLVQGPSGTGKELVAQALHKLSSRANGPFIAVHCAALTPSLLESELFGHEKGAFTGATQRTTGRFEQANGGTLFLDEISEIDANVQVKLLRVLESRTFNRVGSGETLECDIRVVAATNRNLAAYVAEGKFREDLYYRLNVVDIRLPSLAERGGDIALLAARFVKEFAEKNSKEVTNIDTQAIKMLEHYSWPGNVRELRNTIEKMVVLCDGPTLTAADVPEEIAAAQNVVTPSARASTATAMPKLPPEEEKAMILEALKACNGNRSHAADKLGISRRTMFRKLAQYKLENN